LQDSFSLGDQRLVFGVFLFGFGFSFLALLAFLWRHHLSLISSLTCTSITLPVSALSYVFFSLGSFARPVCVFSLPSVCPPATLRARAAIPLLFCFVFADLPDKRSESEPRP
jgi:hypothetical protein